MKRVIKKEQFEPYIFSNFVDNLLFFCLAILVIIAILPILLQIIKQEIEKL